MTLPVADLVMCTYACIYDRAVVYIAIERGSHYNRHARRSAKKLNWFNQHTLLLLSTNEEQSNVFTYLKMNLWSRSSSGRLESAQTTEKGYIVL